ncbi:TPA: pyridoxal-phosphate dependent enzyme [Bacillus cereus]
MIFKIIKNSRIQSLQCLRCSATYEINDFFEGCPKCLAKKMPSSLNVIYTNYDNTCLLPYSSYISLGEGNTPLIPLDESKYGNVYIKYEGQNPTGSHKDRMSSLIVTRAIEKGCKGIAIASSGNAGVSLAAYAAYANIPCTVIATDSLNKNILSLLKNYGAQTIITNTYEDRWNTLQKLTKDGFYPASNYILPPVGSNFFGVQGYKKIAYEILQQLKGLVPTKVIVPVSRGDLLWGIWQGFKEMHKSKLIATLPNMIAVEPFARLTRVLNGSLYTQEFFGETMLKSLDGTTVTFQAWNALTESNGLAIVISSNQALQSQQILLKKGIFLELSASSTIAALKKLQDKKLLNKTDIVIAIGTSSGFLEV